MNMVLYERWVTRRHVGAAKPTCRVTVRTGRFKRAYTPWTTTRGDPLRVNAQIHGEKPSRPWTATWTPESAWVELPNVNQVTLTQDFDSNGIAVATITLDNVVLSARHGPFGELYHLIERGYLSPWRGSAGPVRAQAAAANEWYGKLSRNAQVRVYEGYGDAMTPVWTGLIDDCDVSSRPDTITITARDFGKTLTDQDVFGWTVSPQLPEPTLFRSLGVGADGSEGTGVGYGASASSERAGHPARFVDDANVQTIWISTDHTTPANTEWVQIRLPRGRYESFAIHTGQPGMEMYVGVYARSAGLGGEPCQLDGNDIDDGWIVPSALPDPSRGGENVPGAHGGWPYIKHWTNVSDKGHTNTFPAALELGDDSVLRIALRDLYQVTQGVYRAGVVRLQAIRRKPAAPVALVSVGGEALASSTRDASSDEGFWAPYVLDTAKNTRWLSIDHSTPDNTEWVQITLPRGRYDSLRIDPAYAGMDCYIGVQLSRSGRRSACQVDLADVADGWAPGLGDVPGAHGGWPYVHMVSALDRPASVAKIPLGHRFDVGDDTIVRVALRGLHAIDAGVYRAGVTSLHALTRTGVRQPDEPSTSKVVLVDDLSDAVKCALRWAGFKEWDIEPVGAPVKGTAIFNRSHTLMDIIKAAQAVTGYVFYMAPPSDADDSIGVPTFRSNMAIVDAPDQMPEIRDTDMISAIQVKATDEQLFHIIRVRGKTSEKFGTDLGADTSGRVMAVYRPPWALQGKLAGLLKHVTHTEEKLAHTSQCMVMCELIALQEALVASAAEVDIPGVPGFSLNSQVGLLDTGTGLNTRLFIARRSSTFTAGQGTAWTTTLGGALIDTDDIRGVISDLRATLQGMGLDPDKVNLGDPFGASS